MNPLINRVYKKSRTEADPSQYNWPHQGTTFQVHQVHIVPVSSPAYNAVILKRGIMKLVEDCCDEHPEISTEKDVKGGLPHIKGTRVTVQSILDRLSVYGDVKKVKKSFLHINEAQIKAAIAYARDFMEKACVQSEVNDR